jgi:hypothetical protein
MLTTGDAATEGLAGGDAVVDGAVPADSVIVAVVEGATEPENVGSGMVVGASIDVGSSPPPARLPIRTPSKRLDASATEIKMRRVRSTPPFIVLLKRSW